MPLADELFTKQEEEPKPPRYIVRNAAYALQPQAPPDWIVNNLISTSSVSIVFGESGSKKTYAMLSLGVCVALGKKWLNFDTKQSRVLFVDEEMGEYWVCQRLGRAIRGELGRENIPFDFISLGGFKLDNRKSEEILEAEIKRLGSQLVIIDSLSEVMDGDENSKQETLPVFNATRRISASTGAAMVLVHHPNKMGMYRGSSAIKQAVDLMIKVECKDGSDWIKFTSEKVRHIEPATFNGEFTWTDDQYYLQYAENTNSNDKKISPPQAYVIQYLTEHGQTGLQKIMSAADRCAPRTAKQAVYDLVTMGIVYRTNPDDTGRGTDAIYDLKEQPEIEPATLAATVVPND
jgi:RecA-family ATPase